MFLQAHTPLQSARARSLLAGEALLVAPQGADATQPHCWWRPPAPDATQPANLHSIAASPGNPGLRHPNTAQCFEHQGLAQQGKLGDLQGGPRQQHTPNPGRACHRRPGRRLGRPRLRRTCQKRSHQPGPLREHLGAREGGARGRPGVPQGRRMACEGAAHLCRMHSPARTTLQPTASSRDASSRTKQPCSHHTGAPLTCKRKGNAAAPKAARLSRGSSLWEGRGTQDGAQGFGNLRHATGICFPYLGPAPSAWPQPRLLAPAAGLPWQTRHRRPRPVRQ